MILLGIAIAGFIGSFGNSAEELAKNTDKQIDNFTTDGAF